MEKGEEEEDGERRPSVKQKIPLKILTGKVL